MKITIVYGTEHRGATWHMAGELVRCFPKAKVTTVMLPRDLPEFCSGCMRCFIEEKGTCPHHSQTDLIRKKLLWADLIVLTSPVYAYHVSGAMKVFLDHFANMWMVHRPEKAMFQKQGVVIAAASGPVYKKTLNEMKDSLDFWGVRKTYRIGSALLEGRWDHVSTKLKRKINRQIKRTAARVIQGSNKTAPSLRVRKWFHISRIMQKFIGMNPPDVHYWNQMGWTGRNRPWKEK